MTRFDKPNVPVVPGIDLEFRPGSYWDHADPVSAIVQNIKGQNRREMARAFVAGRAPAELGEIESELLEDEVSEERRRTLGLIAPSWMGGEYLPAYRVGEVEIARIVLQSSTQDVFSIRASRSRDGSRIRYRMLDEYKSKWTITPASSSVPLSLRQLVHMVDTCESDGGSLVFGSLSFLADSYSSPEELADFVSADSTVYQQLGAYYQAITLGYARELMANPDEQDE